MESKIIFNNKMNNIFQQLWFGVFVVIICITTYSCDLKNKKDGSQSTTTEGKSNVIKSTHTRSYFIREKFGKVVIDDKVFESTLDEYSKEGQLISKTDSGSFSSVEISKYVYNEKGNNTEINIYDEYGGLNGKKINKIDELGHISEQITYNSNGDEIAIFKFVYDNMGNQIARKTYIDGVYKFTTKYKYDLKGNKIYEWDGSIKNGQSTYDYEFDNKGNWIVGGKYEGGKKWLIIKRDIIYY